MVIREVTLSTAPSFGPPSLEWAGMLEFRVGLCRNWPQNSSPYHASESLASTLDTSELGTITLAKGANGSINRAIKTAVLQHPFSIPTGMSAFHAPNRVMLNGTLRVPKSRLYGIMRAI